MQFRVAEMELGPLFVRQFPECRMRSGHPLICRTSKCQSELVQSVSCGGRFRKVAFFCGLRALESRGQAVRQESSLDKRPDEPDEPRSPIGDAVNRSVDGSRHMGKQLTERP